MNWIIFFALSANLHAGEVGLHQALQEAEANSPKLKSAHLQTEAAKEQVRSAKSGYMPSVDLAVIASDGSPGSFGFMGVDNNISANDRIGEGGGATLRQTLWDFGRTANAVKTADSQRELEETNAVLSTSQIDLDVLQIYLNCSYLKSAIDDAEFTVQQARVIAGETGKYVQSGQRSIIERYLVDAQAQEAETLSAELKARVTNVQQRLALMLGRPEGSSAECGALGHGESDVASLEKAAKKSPLIELYRASANVARFKLDEAKADERPALLGVVTGGYFHDIQAKDGWNYAAGVGLTFPLFDGFRRDSEIDRRKAELGSSEALVDFSRQTVDEANSRYGEQIKAVQVRLTYLDKEIKLAKEAFKLAKTRYFGFKGTMVDLRESLRNLNRVMLSIDEAHRDLMIARGSYAIYNGARP
jgi:outer membrane protein